MKHLLTDEIKAMLPKLYSQEKVIDPRVYVHLYATGSEAWHWYVLEGQQTDDGYILYAWVVGWENELGFVSLLELEAVNDRSLRLEIPDHVIVAASLPQIIDGEIVRDEAWKPLPLSVVQRNYKEL